MSDQVLVINAGSSSLKYSVVDESTGATAATGLVERIGETEGSLVHRTPSVETRVPCVAATHAEAVGAALASFHQHGPDLESLGLAAVGHRVVHGGSRYSEPARVDDVLLAAVRDLVPLAPLHNPANLSGIEAALTLFPGLPQVAVFDTAFHQTLPPHAYTYAVPHEWRAQHGIRRYGFHGTSHAFVAGEAARLLGRDLRELNLIVLHLGNGCSATAISQGRSVDTSMGLTPLEGLVMGTRSGDVDPALHAHLARTLGLSLAQIDDTLNRRSGVKGIAGVNDFRELERRLADGDEHAQLAFDVYCYRIRKYVGAYYAVLGRVDAIVFTAGVGEHSAAVRAEALEGLDGWGITLDPTRNAASAHEARVISSEEASVAVLVVPTDEEWHIARETMRVVRRARGH
ncbi:MAG TPA: acetate kinase [Nocardioidaceae bacterium]|nr:acetate kinase [Nocardioidaceae bacterium]